jgi:hypothetical protein
MRLSTYTTVLSAVIGVTAIHATSAALPSSQDMTARMAVKINLFTDSTCQHAIASEQANIMHWWVDECTASTTSGEPFQMLVCSKAGDAPVRKTFSTSDCSGHPVRTETLGCTSNQETSDYDAYMQHVCVDMNDDGYIFPLQTFESGANCTSDSVDGVLEPGFDFIPANMIDQCVRAFDEDGIGMHSYAKYSCNEESEIVIQTFGDDSCTDTRSQQVGASAVMFGNTAKNTCNAQAIQGMDMGGRPVQKYDCIYIEPSRTGAAGIANSATLPLLLAGLMVVSLSHA